VTINTPSPPSAGPDLYSPGTLVHARGREWIVLAGSDADTLRVRPVSGSEADATLLYVPLESEPVRPARFPLPGASERASHDAALLLRDALLLSLRRGAGPFRSFGQIAVEPRAYQLVPLLMALKLDPVRLLIADDVGVGKTIEAALIARELLDRGEVERMTVLCPPHLVEQWIGELEHRFHLRAVGVTAASAARLESHLPPAASIFTAHPHTVVSLDYIKADRRRADFLRACPELVIVDEAHACVGNGAGRHQRYELLRGLVAAPNRHLVLLTATPHSGDEVAFYRLLGLLDPAFEALADEAAQSERSALRERLARHFVQRRRPDIEEWQDGRLFPRRETAELTYELTGPWLALLHDVLDYCAGVAAAAGDDARRARLSFWGTLALMRCVASSPAAAVQALRTRATRFAFDLAAGDGAAGPADEAGLAASVFDGSDEALPDDDVEPPAGSDDPALARLIAAAEALTAPAAAARDPKLVRVVAHVAELLAAGFSPVVFCRYIATAHYLRRQLAAQLGNRPAAGAGEAVTVGVVTGELTADEREEAVATLGEAEVRVLVATDCLSEGINLQQHFDAVVHYDLSWNPTRHEQREGRVDRFGQTGPKGRSENERPLVRTTLLYGANNPVDGAVLQVILRKGARIREQLGVPVPLPDEGHSLSRALMEAVLLRRGGNAAQATLDFTTFPEARALATSWQDAAEKAKRNRTIFAQRRLRPDEVLPEWRKTLAAVGGSEDVRRFVERALARLGAGLEPVKGGRRGYKAPTAPLPAETRERLEAEGLEGTLRLDFAQPPAPGCRAVTRSHPLVAVLADTLLERTLASAATGSTTASTPATPAAESPGAAPTGDPGVLGRVGCWVSPAVAELTTVVLLRLRHQLATARAGRGRATQLLVEEAAAIAWRGAAARGLIEGDEVLALLAAPPVGDPPAHVRATRIERALALLGDHAADLDAFAERRAEALLADHRRVREASDTRGQARVHWQVKALLPPDVVALYVLLPRV
jgi:superfamily II DNA or RNA helicase